jgi:hypothetical protein
MMAGAVMAKSADVQDVGRAVFNTAAEGKLTPARIESGKALATRALGAASKRLGTGASTGMHSIRRASRLLGELGKYGSVPDYMGLALSKLAVNWAGLASSATKGLGMAGGAAKGLGGSLWNYASKNPLKAGLTAAGAVGGAMASGGLQKDEHGQRHLGRAALGAMGGGVAGHTAATVGPAAMKNFSANRAAGQGFGTALGNTALSGVQNMAGKLNQ